MAVLSTLSRALLPGLEQRWSPSSNREAMYAAGFGRRATSVGYDASQAHGAVYACVDLLCRMVAWQMPVEVTRNGRPIDPPPIVTSPHPQPQLGEEHWRAGVLESALLRGYTAGLVVDVDRQFWPTSIEPLHPDAVSWTRERGAVEWRVNGQREDLWQTGNGRLWICPAPRVPPGSPIGLSPIRYAAQQISLGLDARTFALDYFRAGGMPVSHVKHAEPNVPRETADDLKERVLTATRNREPLVTGSAITLDVIRIAPEESQFLETIRANVADVCMFFGIRSENIGGASSDPGTYQNVQGRRLDLLTDVVGAWRRWFARLYEGLLPPGHTVTLDPEAMLQMSVAELYTTMQTAVGRGGPGVLTINEARAVVGYDPLPDPAASTLFVPANVVPADPTPGGAP